MELQIVKSKVDAGYVDSNAELMWKYEGGNGDKISANVIDEEFKSEQWSPAAIILRYDRNDFEKLSNATQIDLMYSDKTEVKVHTYKGEELSDLIAFMSVALGIQEKSAILSIPPKNPTDVVARIMLMVTTFNGTLVPFYPSKKED